MSRAVLLVLELVGVTLFASSTFTTLFFIGAETPEEAARSACHWPIPAGAEAVVANHGSYMKWYTISGHPILFGLSISGVLLAGWLLHYVQKNYRRNRSSGIC